MFHGTGEDNQYSGMVARSQVPPQHDAPTSATENVLVRPNTSSSQGRSHAANLRSSIADLVHHAHPSKETHEPFGDDEPVDTTPILLHRLRLVVAAATAAKEQAHINKNQCALAVRRLRLIEMTLKQMPKPAPSQRLLSAAESLCLLLRQCAHEGGALANSADCAEALQVLYGPASDPLGPAQCWPVLLCRQFTCRPLFQAAYRRLWDAWSMYSRVELEREDGTAEAQDRADDAVALMELLFPLGPPAATALAGNDDPQRALLAHYQRQELSPWRILFQDLEETQEPVPGAVTAQDGTGDDVAFRVLPHVYRYQGVPVVVKALCGPAGALSSSEAAAAAAAMELAPDFLLDVVCRTMWCHSHLVTWLGGYTEKFDDALHAEIAAAAADATHDFSEATAQKPIAADTGDLPWQRATATLNGTPVMALGYVLELQTASLPAAVAPSQAACTTLRDFLFASTGPAGHRGAARDAMPVPVVGQHRFTLHEALDICGQLADAVQYMLDDSREVSAMVKTAWLTLDPANVFVVRVVGLSGEEERLLQQQREEQQEQHQREQAERQQHKHRGHGRPRGERAVTPPSNSELADDDDWAFSPSVASHVDGEALSHHPLAPPSAKKTNVGCGPLSGRSHESRDAPVGVAEHTRSYSPSEWEADVYVHTEPAGKKAGKGGEECDSTADTGSAASPLQHRSRHFVVRYCPPCQWAPRAGEVGSRWRPHPRATAPGSYVVMQLFLALVTGQVPYVHLATDDEVDARVFALDAAAAVKLNGSGQGYAIPASLPPMIVNWCRSALSLDRSQPAMELEALRDALATIQASLPEHVRHSPVALEHGDGAAAAGLHPHVGMAPFDVASD